MTSSVEEICQIVGTYAGRRWDADDNRWVTAKEILGNDRVTLGPVASHSWLHQPDHVAFQLARYRAAAALIGDAQTVLEIGCGEGIGAGILARGRLVYVGVDTDRAALEIARDTHVPTGGQGVWFGYADALKLTGDSSRVGSAEAVVSLDVIEHIPADREDDFMRNAVAVLPDHGVMVLGTPNAAFDHLASPQSKAGHCNLYSHDRLHTLMGRYFHVVQSFGMNDTGIHLGHPEARHYLLMAGIGPRR